MKQVLATSLALVLVFGCSPALPGTPLVLTTASSGGGCPDAALLPVRIDRDGDEMVFVSVATGDRVSLVWPSGFAARLVDSVPELIASNGAVIGRKGDVLDNLGGGLDVSGSAFHVCSIGSTTY